MRTTRKDNSAALAAHLQAIRDRATKVAAEAGLGALAGPDDDPDDDGGGPGPLVFDHEGRPVFGEGRTRQVQSRALSAWLRSHGERPRLSAADQQALRLCRGLLYRSDDSDEFA